jgi:hypothetical protein
MHRSHPILNKYFSFFLPFLFLFFLFYPLASLQHYRDNQSFYVHHRQSHNRTNNKRGYNRDDKKDHNKTKDNKPREKEVQAEIEEGGDGWQLVQDKHHHHKQPTNKKDQHGLFSRLSLSLSLFLPPFLPPIILLTQVVVAGAITMKMIIIKKRRIIKTEKIIRRATSLASRQDNGAILMRPLLSPLKLLL